MSFVLDASVAASWAFPDERDAQIDVQEAPRVGEYRALLDLAHTSGLSVYDAAYLGLALRLRVPLATLDQNLARAALERAVPRA